MRRDDLCEQLLFIELLDQIIKLCGFFFRCLATPLDFIISVARFWLYPEIAIDDDHTLRILVNDTCIAI